MPKRRGLHETGADDGGDAEDDEGADVHGALPRLLVDICRCVSVRTRLRGKQDLCVRHPERKDGCASHTCTGRGMAAPGVLSLSKRDYGADGVSIRCRETCVHAAKEGYSACGIRPRVGYLWEAWAHSW